MSGDAGGPDRLVWLRWERTAKGRFRIEETHAAGDGYRKVRLEAASLDEAAAWYGEQFRELVEEVLASGSDRGRYRP